jgi:lipoyl-dependent peroxiredoxin
LFAAGFAACFEGAMGTILRKKKIKTEGITITSNVTLGKDASDGYVLAVNMDVCPYAKATRGNIEVVTNVVG